MLLLAILLSAQIDSFDTARDLARCQALYESLAFIYASRDEPATAEQYRGMSRGAMVAAEFFAHSYTDDEASASEMVENFFQIERNRLASLAERGNLDLELAEYCHITLQPIQVEVIEMLRREAYRPE